jgi:hypothetical protein
MLYGPYMAKFSLVPVSSELQALTGAEVDLAGRPNGLREALKSFFATHGGEWEFRAQLLTDREKMPVEDASIVWPEDLSPYIPIARLSGAWRGLRRLDTWTPNGRTTVRLSS